MPRKWITGQEALALAGASPAHLEADVLAGDLPIRVYLIDDAPPIRLNLHRVKVDGLDWPASMMRLRDSAPKRFEVSRAQLVELYEIGTSEQPRNRGGRPPKWDWDAFWCELAAQVHEEGLPASAPEMVESMVEWFVAEYDGHPHRDEIAKRVRRLYARLGR
jgi:hypothetical protein